MEKAKSIEPMKSEDIKTLVRLNNLATDNAYRVARIFKKLNRSYEFIYSWEFSEKYVYGTGTETWNYGGSEDHYVDFPIIYLSLDDEELENVQGGLNTPSIEQVFIDLKEKAADLKDSDLLKLGLNLIWRR